MKRTFDVAVAATGLMACLPLLLAIALIIRAQVGSPVLFRQRRAGRNGVEFEILKFRTMRGEAYRGESDAHRTLPIGHLLRTTSLDELPQLWNVLRGDMSIIGPRPTLPEQVEHYDEVQRRRLEVPPGITGYAQVIGRNALSWPERIELDIWYIDHRSLRLDLWILLMTVARLLRPQGITGEDGVNPGFPVADSQPGGAETAYGNDRAGSRAGQRSGGHNDDREMPYVINRGGDGHGGKTGGGNGRSRITVPDPQASEHPQQQREREPQSG